MLCLLFYMLLLSTLELILPLSSDIKGICIKAIGRACSCFLERAHLLHALLGLSIPLPTILFYAWQFYPHRFSV